MNKLVRQERDVLNLLLNTSNKQKIVLLQTIEKQQLNAIVQIVYNILQGYRPLLDKDKRLLAKRKDVIRHFVSKGVSLKNRKHLLLKYFKYILPFISLIKSELS